MNALLLIRILASLRGISKSLKEANRINQKRLDWEMSRAERVKSPKMVKMEVASVDEWNEEYRKVNPYEPGSP